MHSDPTVRTQKTCLLYSITVSTLWNGITPEIHVLYTLEIFRELLKYDCSPKPWNLELCLIIFVLWLVLPMARIFSIHTRTHLKFLSFFLNLWKMKMAFMRISHFISTAVLENILGWDEGLAESDPLRSILKSLTSIQYWL